MNPEIKSALLRVLPFVFILLGLFIANRRKKISKTELGLKMPISTKAYFAWIVGFLFLIIGVEFALYKFGLLEVDHWHHPFGPSIIRIIGAVILGPIAEELIFRGLIYNLLKKKLNNIHVTVFLQACFFVLLHSFTYQNTMSSNIGIAQTFVDATLFAYARYYTKSIFTPITMHITGNLIATLERFIF